MSLKDYTSRFYESSSEIFSNLGSSFIERYDNTKNYIKDHRDRIINGTKKATISAVVGGILLTGTPALAEKTDKAKEIKVPINKIMKTIDECELSAEQWGQTEVKVPVSCVSEDYLDEINYKQSTENQEKVPEGFEKEELPGNFKDIEEFWLSQYDDDPRIEGVFVDNQENRYFLGREGDYLRRAMIAPFPFGEDSGEMNDKIYVIPRGKVSEVRSGDLDGDGIEEAAI
ncbi:MAG: hypothetical protein ABEK17_04945, partial [Candidatus Aenigmatarchaeota archaeon]